MPKARYSITYGLAGCYMPDSYTGPYLFTTRRELAATVRDMLEMYEMPRSAIRQIKLNRIWSHIKRHGSSVAHFSIHHKGNVLAFHGLTEEEFNNANEEEFI